MNIKPIRQTGLSGFVRGRLITNRFNQRFEALHLEPSTLRIIPQRYTKADLDNLLSRLEGIKLVSDKSRRMLKFDALKDFGIPKLNLTISADPDEHKFDPASNTFTFGSIAQNPEILPNCTFNAFVDEVLNSLLAGKLLVPIQTHNELKRFGFKPEIIMPSGFQIERLERLTADLIEVLSNLEFKDRSDFWHWNSASPYQLVIKELKEGRSVAYVFGLNTHVNGSQPVFGQTEIIINPDSRIWERQEQMKILFKEMLGQIKKKNHIRYWTWGSGP